MPIESNSISGLLIRLPRTVSYVNTNLWICIAVCHITQICACANATKRMATYTTHTRSNATFLHQVSANHNNCRCSVQLKRFIKYIGGKIQWKHFECIFHFTEDVTYRWTMYNAFSIFKSYLKSSSDHIFQICIIALTVNLGTPVHWFHTWISKVTLVTLYNVETIFYNIWHICFIEFIHTLTW